MSETVKLVEAVAKAIEADYTRCSGVRLEVEPSWLPFVSQARAAIAVTVEACARVADDYAAKMRAAAERPHPVTGRENAIALCKQDAGETMAAAIRALAPTSPSAEEK